MYSAISNIIPTESRTIAALVKKHVQLADSTARVIMFGSRVRGDASTDSDWDFLVLTQQIDTAGLADNLRKVLLREVELKYDVAISLIVKNAFVWESDYAITNIYKSIAEEGKQL